jgi:hypothetical protein
MELKSIIFCEEETLMNRNCIESILENDALFNIEKNMMEARAKSIFQEFKIELLRIKAAKYKAYFFHKFQLAEKLEKQERENEDALVGEWDGMCYASWRAKAVFRTLEDMRDEGIITESEYKECE